MPPPTETTEDELVTPSRAAALLGVHPDTLSGWADAGRLDVTRTTGGHRRYRRDQVDALVASSPRGAAQQAITQARALQARAMTEAQLLAAVRALAKALGWLSYHTHRSYGSEPGFPDLVLVRGHAVLYRELKTSRGRISEAQVEWLGALSAAGQDAGVWRPEDLLERRVETTLRSLR